MYVRFHEYQSRLYKISVLFHNFRDGSGQYGDKMLNYCYVFSQLLVIKPTFYPILLSELADSLKSFGISYSTINIMIKLRTILTNTIKTSFDFKIVLSLKCSIHTQVRF